MTFEQYLLERFMDLREVDGVPIIKDNCEDMFDSWLAQLDGNEYMEYAQIWGEKQYLHGKEFVLNEFKIDIEDLQAILTKYKK